MRSKLVLTIAFAISLLARTASAHGPGGEMADAANNLLNSLNPEQKKKATYELTSEERKNWHFVPKERNGLPLTNMNGAQKSLAHALLASSLSTRGYVKASTIMSLELILQEMEGPSRRFPREPELYFVTVFGTPGETNTWGWRWEGHHFAANFTIVNGHEVSGSPTFMGTNPAEIRTGPQKGLRVLAAEEDMARSLVKSLNEDLRKKAVFDTKAPADIITLADKKVTALKDVGVAYSQLNAEQQRLVLDLIREYVNRTRPEIANKDLAKIAAAGMEKITFGWAGGLDMGQPHYYRIQGPTFVLEYDNTQNNANHVHSAWRDFDGDFGDDILSKHYAQTPHGK